MKKIFFLLLIIAGILLINHYVDFSEQISTAFPAPCDEPITYKIGSIHRLYPINEQELKKLLKSINNSWSATIDKELFAYRKNGDITINLIYGKQQKFMRKEQTATSRIEIKKTAYETKENEIARLKKNYKRVSKEYESLITDYKDLMNSPNFRYKADEKQNQINQKQAQINRMVNTINQKIAELNTISSDISEMVTAYNNKYGSYKEFNQGDYKRTRNGETINVYSYKNKDDLRLVLAHEMGHTLGLQHVNNAESVMYYLMEDQTTDSLSFTQEDIAALQTKCKI